MWQHGGAKRLSLLHSITHLLNRLDPTNAISVRSLAHLERLNTMLNIFVEQFGKKKKKKKKKKKSGLGSFSGHFTDCFTFSLPLLFTQGEKSKWGRIEVTSSVPSLGTRYIPLLQASVECSSVSVFVCFLCFLLFSLYVSTFSGGYQVTVL